jgi:hypothetical protein
MVHMQLFRISGGLFVLFSFRTSDFHHFHVIIQFRVAGYECCLLPNHPQSVQGLTMQDSKVYHNF